MDVAVMYSGGKDSTYAIQHALDKRWNIKYIISVKPTRKDCYLFHYATVEHTKELAKNFRAKHCFLKCSVADPKKEAEIIKELVQKNQRTKKTRIEALLLGGTGLQETQLKSLQKAMLPLRVEVFASHAGLDHDKVMEQMLDKGYDIMITQIASDGLKRWLGERITRNNFEELKKDSVKYGFHVGGEGGYYDTLVTNAPLFKKLLQVQKSRKVFDDDYCGHVIIDKATLVARNVKLKIQ